MVMGLHVLNKGSLLTEAHFSLGSSALTVDICASEMIEICTAWGQAT